MRRISQNAGRRNPACPRVKSQLSDALQARSRPSVTLFPFRHECWVRCKSHPTCPKRRALCSLRCLVLESRKNGPSRTLQSPRQLLPDIGPDCRHTCRPRSIQASGSLTCRVLTMLRAIAGASQVRNSRTTVKPAARKQQSTHQQSRGGKRPPAESAVQRPQPSQQNFTTSGWYNRVPQPCLP